MNKNTHDVCDDICSDVWDRQTLSCNLTSYILLCATNQSLGQAYDRLSKLEPDNELERSNCYEFDRILCNDVEQVFSDILGIYLLTYGK